MKWKRGEFMYTGFYIRINTEDELQLFCDYLNQRYPYKSHWASDHSKNKEIYPKISNDEIEKEIKDLFGFDF